LKIAVFGGSFNPVHNSHILAAREVLRQTTVSEIWFMPCHLHAFKSRAGFASSDDRAQMLRRALKGEKKMRVSTLEIEIGKAKRKENRTIDTVRALKENYPKNEFLWVIGSNLVREVKKWAGFRELIKEIRIIVVPIKGEEKGVFSQKWLKENNALVLSRKRATENISSTQVKEWIEGGRRVLELVPKGVHSFIVEKMLFVPGKFRERVYRAVKMIPRGRVSAYGEIAGAIGSKKSARAVGQALNKNPFFPIVPCHRVIAAGGKIGGFGLGVKRKEKLLKSEGLCVKNGRILDFEKKLMKASDLV